MQNEHRYLKEVLSWITDWCLIIGDVLFAVWIIQLVTQFEAHPSYPFLGLKGWVIIFSIYVVGLVSDIINRRYLP
ncbi:hypothetical protein BZA03_104171 [Alteromonas sp. I10]|uniref:hypothetical protein n=1 Tax=Alteromonas sp. I10 TaxID=1938740 RepID=UPI000D75BD58|nr:hypothetical protein [Alteromonas sp. I10]PXW74087.1 hypothetical protein BZA03_104171 [Alteromonas sp. I10]